MCDIIPISLTKFLQLTGFVKYEFIMNYTKRYEMENLIHDIVPFGLRVRDLNSHNLLLCRPNKHLRKFAKQVTTEYDKRVKYLKRHKKL